MQVRRASTRLPDKVLLPLQGEHLFLRQLERMRASNLAGSIVIATTISHSDDLIADICAEKKIPCFRGHPSDLLDRHYQAAKLNHADIVIKIPSDCPMIDPAVIDKVIGFFLEHQNEVDYVSNLHPATYPDGNDVEIMHFKVLETAWQYAQLDFEREHTTPYIWERTDTFRIGNIKMKNDVDHSLTHRWTIDYPEDYEFINQVYNELYHPGELFSMESVLELVSRRPDIYALNHHLAGINWYRHHMGQLRTIGSLQKEIID